MINPDSETTKRAKKRFVELCEKFNNEWKKSEKNSDDSKVIAKWILDWIDIEKDITLVGRIFDTFIKHHREFKEFNEESQEKIRKRVVSSLYSEDPLWPRLEEIRNHILKNGNCSSEKLLYTVENSHKSAHFNSEEYEQELVELEKIGILRRDSQGKNITILPIYRDIIEQDRTLCNALQKIRESPETSSDALTPNQNQNGAIETEAEKEPQHVKIIKICVTFLVFVVIGSLLYKCMSPVASNTSSDDIPSLPGKGNSPEEKFIEENCREFRKRLRDISQVEKAQLIDQRDSLIKEIDQFQKNKNDSLGNLCGGQKLDIEFAKLLRNQAYRLAESSYFTGSGLIRSNDSPSEYGAVRCLCLIPQDLLSSEEDFKDVKSKLGEWKSGSQAEAIKAELSNIESCPAANL
ncbi:MAG: hypothetical protein SW833_05620 [Cyanobacteriota bacterium]|nr:hypothetical protein [Cyanobacteriota bacterium]